MSDVARKIAEKILAEPCRYVPADDLRLLCAALLAGPDDAAMREFERKLATLHVATRTAASVTESALAIAQRWKPVVDAARAFAFDQTNENVVALCAAVGEMERAAKAS